MASLRTLWQSLHRPEPWAAKSLSGYGRSTNCAKKGGATVTISMCSSRDSRRFRFVVEVHQPDRSRNGRKDVADRRSMCLLLFWSTTGSFGRLRHLWFWCRRWVWALFWCRWCVWNLFWNPRFWILSAHGPMPRPFVVHAHQVSRSARSRPRGQQLNNDPTAEFLRYDCRIRAVNLAGFPDWSRTEVLQIKCLSAFGSGRALHRVALGAAPYASSEHPIRDRCPRFVLRRR
jgi:hypothetical protein